MLILGIETSCDETALSLIEAGGGFKDPQFKILKNLVSSQIKIHRPYGGVVPNLAKREHVKNLPIIYQKIFGLSNSQILIPKQIPNSQSKILKAIDLIAVTVGPGLEPCLWAGINFAKELYSRLKSLNSKIKLIGANHLEGHLYSFLLSSKNIGFKFEILNSKQKTPKFKISNLDFPAILLLVSGGHTILLLMKDLVNYKKLGETRDDAVGESFDKVARLLGLSYPGGPEIEKIARQGNSRAVQFPRPMINQKNYDFSFSGLKTAVFYYLRDQRLNIKNSRIKADIAAAFQAAAFDVLIQKTLRAVTEFGAKSIFISGGVASNKFFQKKFVAEIKRQRLNVNFRVPPKKFCLDNAAMIAAAAYFNFLRKKKYQLVAQGGLDLK